MGIFPLEKSRTGRANKRFSLYQCGKKKITNLDRDERLSHGAALVCAHLGCVAPQYHWDHVLPLSRLSGESLQGNQVRSCPRCNTSRGNKDLMGWHRQNVTFPSLGMLRRYLKLCYFHAEPRGLLTQSVEEAAQRGLPFEPKHMPRKFPPVEHLVWEYGYQDRRPVWDSSERAVPQHDH